MSGIRDTATVTLNVNGAQAKQMMSEIEQKISDTKKKISDLKANMADPKDIQKARKELKSYEKQLDEIKSSTEGVEKALNNLDSATPRQLEKALRTLNKQLKDMTPGSETWNSHIEKIKELKERIAELKDETREQESLWKRFADWSVSAWPALDLLGQWGSGFADLARSAVDAFAEMDQEMANVRKFTGMTAEQVDDLNEAFKKMDTRTSREDLNKLAQEAGRLGKTSSEDILGFVRAADKINVALDDLGEGATLTLSKLTGIFGDEKVYGTEQALLKVGSVINELSQNCSASAPYLSNFAERMGGVGAQAGLSIPQIMGFGAVLDSNAQKVEASATALSQIIVRLYQDPAKYAKVAGIDVEKFSKLMREDANSAVILFLETLQKAGGMDSLSPMFKDMGETGSRAIAALSTLAEHIDDVKAQQEAANVAFEEGTSVTKEFNVQNNTVQAGLDKCKKAAQEIRVELGEKLQPIVSHLLSSTSAFMRTLLTLVRYMEENRATVVALAMAIVAWTVALNANVVATKLWTVATNVATVAGKTLRTVVLALSTVYYTLTGNITKATAATRALNIAMKGNLFGIIATAIALVIAKLIDYTTKANEAAKAQAKINKEQKEWRDGLRDIDRQSEEYSQKELARLDLLYKAATDDSKSKKERINAVNELKKQYPDYFSKLTTEQIMLGQAKQAYDDLTTAIIKSANARAAYDKIADLGSQKLDENATLKDDQRKKSALEKKREKTNAALVNARKKMNDNASIDDQQSAEWRKWYNEVQRLLKQQNEIDEQLKTINANIATTTSKIDEINKAQTDLAQEYGVDINAAIAGEQTTPADPPKNTPYVSTILTDKEKKKAEREARAAAIKAKKEFKEQLDQIKAARDKEQTEILALRMMGEINYIEYNKRKLAADEKYYDDSIALYEKWEIQEDDECQALARKREEFLNKSNEQRLGLNKEVIQRIAQAEERDLKARYASKTSHTLAEELRLEEEILSIRYNALMDQQALYKKTDKEYEEYQRQIDDLFLKDQESKQKKLLAKVEEFRKKFDYQPVKVKYDMERAALEELYRLKKIKEEEYRKWLKKLNEQEAQDEKKDKEELPGMKIHNNRTNAKEALKTYNEQKQKLDEALSAGIINESEYETALKRIGVEFRKSLVSPLHECKSEWVSLMSTMMESWAEFADALKDPDGDPFGALSSAIEATAAVANSVMSMVTEFQKAEYEIQSAEVKKRYDAEVDAAQGNSFRIRKLEEAREKDLANLKNEQSKKQFAMQVVATVAQTAANAVQAFGAGLAVGGLAGLILAPIAAAMAVAQGAVQIALIKKQQQAAAAQGYSKGGFTKPGAVDEPAGIVHAGEWVASQKLLANPVARPMIEALDYAQRTNTIGSIKDEDVSRSIRATDSMVRIAESNDSSALMVAAIAHNAETISSLNERLKYPIDAAVSIAGDHGVAQAEDKYKMYLKNKSPKNF